MPDSSLQSKMGGVDSKTTNTTIHNHITKQSTQLDLSPLMNALNAFMLSTRQCAYPQLVVSCRGQRAAFSRASLGRMDYRRAKDLFIERFARPEDYLEVPPSGGWLYGGGRRDPPDVECFATFCRPEEDLGVAMALHSSGWGDNIGNVRELEVVMRPKVASDKIKKPQHDI
ncbi:hypothetical protein C8F04DRAFT_101630 [Mycena alexandri]|uniref:Uncharacterized protein n=1 Tax=Mycena alexandri TaxID=1745969 RepID=A0AAD6WXD3_9AGAR|nr:hypothetical protein C8F04DRAFT_101630 [Mycena alexandri]